MKMNVDKDKYIIGNHTFRKIWDAWEVEQKDVKGARDKLAMLMKVADMSELTGSMRQTEYLMEQFSPDLAPHDFFWKKLAKLVQTAFPKGLIDESVKSVELAKLVHQFRYVIDAWQVRYIRENYGGILYTDGSRNDSDEGKLIQYFREMDAKEWDTTESDRLHQKHYIEGEDILFPAGAFGVNIKITYNFHTEFIIQNGDEGRGSFAYILDHSENNQNSILNGASFNYADYNDYSFKRDKKINHMESRHYNLDIETGARLDPEFRKEVNIYFSNNGDKKFSSPSRELYVSKFKPKSDYNKLLLKEMVYKI